MKSITMMAKHAGMLLLAAGAYSAIAQNAPQDPPKTERKDPQAEAAALLCREIIKSVAALPKNAGVTDIEAAILFAISQDAALAEKPKAERDRIVELALTCALGDNPSAALRAAINNVRTSYGFGTGAVQNGGSFGPSSGGVSAFSGPIIGVGGGSSNYTPSR